MDNALKRYEIAILTGDIEYMDRYISRYGYVHLPLFDMDQYTILDTANHEALAWLSENDHILLPDIVSAIVYDDPLPLYGRPLDYLLFRQIIKRGAWDIYLEYKNSITPEMISMLRDISIESEESALIVQDIVLSYY